MLLRPEGVWSLSSWKPKNSVVNSNSDGGCQAADRCFPGLVCTGNSVHTVGQAAKELYLYTSCRMENISVGSLEFGEAIEADFKVRAEIFFKAFLKLKRQVIQAIVTCMLGTIPVDSLKYMKTLFF